MSTARHSHPAPVLMTAQSGGHGAADAPLSVTKATRDLHIDRRILAHPGLSLLACAVLAEVLDLYRVKGQVFASDDHFAERCRSKPRTIRETIAELIEAGFLVREVNNAARQKRRLTPTDLWQNPPQVVAESATTHPEEVAESATSDGEIRHESRQNPPRVVADSANINTNLNTKGNTNLNTAAGAVGAGLEISEESASLAEQPNDASHTEGGATDVATSKPVGPRGWAYDPAAIADSLRLPFASPEFRAAWVRYRSYREEMGFRRLTGGEMEQQQLISLGQLAAGSEANALLLIEQAIGAGWQKFYPLDKNYATARQSPSNRNRPAGNGRVETLPTTNYGRNRGGQAPASPAA